MIYMCAILLDRIQLTKMGGTVLGGAVTTLGAGVALFPSVSTYVYAAVRAAHVLLPHRPVTNDDACHPPPP